MPSFSNWISRETSRAEDAWRRINEKPTPQVFTRNDVNLAAQTVRIEPSNRVMEAGNRSQDTTGFSSVREAIVFGVKDHPTEDDTNIQRGDWFTYEGTMYRVRQVIYPTGEVQATCEAQD